jgi:hypothetical protein
MKISVGLLLCMSVSHRLRHDMMYRTNTNHMMERVETSVDGETISWW